MEITQIGGDIQRETMRSYPAADVYADGGDLAIAHPNSGELGNALRFDSVARERIYNRLLHAAHICAYVPFPIAQVEDGIAHELARPVVGHIAAAVGGIERD